MERKEAERNAVEAIRRGVRRGAYAATGAWADALSEALLRRPAVAVERARVRMRQGRILLAWDALSGMSMEDDDGAACVMAALERACLRMFRDADFERAVAEAEAAMARAERLDGPDAAEADRVHARIRLMAATHFVVPRAAARDAAMRLAAAAETLERAGRTDEALAARLTLAEQAEGEARLHALANVSEAARLAGRPHLAAEARVSRAEHALRLQRATDEVGADLAAAEFLFAEADHAYGAIDVRRVRARLALERQGGGTEELEACLRAYLDAELPSRALSLLMDLSQLAHERGDVARADAWRRQSLSLSEAVGMGLARHSFVLAQADLLMRAGDYGGAIALCEDALARALPPFYAAAYEQLLVSAYALAGDGEAALRHARRAMDQYDALGAEGSASQAAVQVAGALRDAASDAAWEQAESLLRARLRADRRRGDPAAAVLKREMLVSLHLQRHRESPVRAGDPALLDAAGRELARAEAAARGLAGLEGARRRAALQQLRGHLCTVRGDDAGVERAWREALATYEGAGLAMEAANCRYILGAVYLNRANQDLYGWFSAAETSLRDALAYYGGAGMRVRAADTRFMFAQLYTNAAVREGTPLGPQMVEAALDHLAAGEAEYDAIRREFAPGTALDAQRGKQALAASSQRIYDLALQLLLFHRGDVDQAWCWAQRAKARALTDALGAGSATPGRVLAALEAHPDSLRLAVAERDAAVRLQRAAAEDRPALREELQHLQARVDADLHLEEYRELRSGAALEAEDLAGMLPSAADAGRFVFVDWIGAGKRLVLLARRAGAPAQVHVLPIDLGRVRAFVADNLGPHSFRSTLRDMPELLDEMRPLVAPLAGLARPGECLVLCPTGPMHALPLHALEVGGEPLLARNPVVYTPSLTALRHCLARRGPRGTGPRTAAFFGDPGGDRPEAEALVRALGERFGTVPLLEGRVTRGAFADEVAERDLVHFQGHAVHDRVDPLASRLELADGAMTARDIFGLRRLRAEVVVLAACESAANVVQTGDEPLGLIPAFLFAGAQSVLATLWRVKGPSAALAMGHFYDALDLSAADRAEALRRALLAVRATPGLEAPYHWAPFVLHGAWY